MHLKSVSGIVFYVQDLKKTASFYKSLGFTVETEKSEHLSVELNGFWMDFHPQDKQDIPEFQQESNLEHKGSGLFIYISVENVDAIYQTLLDKGISPTSEPKDYSWGNREFIVHDPDGYKLVFFKQK
jgi:uncharacterized glyoxalase superfamily protein PhnB